MRWLRKLENSNLSFYIHQLKEQDAILTNNQKNNKQIICILEGSMKLLKIFSNNEKICVRLMHRNEIINCSEFNLLQAGKYYYSLTAVTYSIIATIQAKEFKIKAKKKLQASICKLKYLNHNSVIYILSHRNTKKRIVQMLLILMQKLGQIRDHKAIIPFHLSHQTIAAITGSQRVTVNRIMNNLKQNGIISYGNKKIIAHHVARLIQE